MKQDWNLIYLKHDIGKEELMAVLWLSHPLIGLLILWLSDSLTAALMQVNLRSKCHITSFDLSDSHIQKSVKGGQGRIVDTFGAATHEIEAKRYLMCLVFNGDLIVVRL